MTLRAIIIASAAAGLAACATDPSPARYAADGWTARTLPELADALRAGDVTAEALTQAYLDRIARVDRAGPTLQSVLALNPEALAQARALDARRAAGEPLGPLHGLPILLKDNIESADPVATTAGSTALARNITGRDAPLAQGLREAGAVILGKTNLSQWANFRSEASLSGWSALGGQVRNPHMLDRNPCGSSSGSGAAVAASLAAGAVGTETNGSIICPANVNGVVGFKPTVGLVSQAGIVPISPSQDAAGPMTKTVRGAAMMLTAMADGPGATDYGAALDADALEGARVGVMRWTQGSNPDIVARFDAALEHLKAAGATLVEIDAFDVQDEGMDSFAVLQFEFKAAMNAYLADAGPAVDARTLADLIAHNAANAEAELALFGQDIFDLSEARGSLDDPEYRAALAAGRAATGEKGIDAMLAADQLDVLVAPSGPVAPRIDPINGDVWPDWAGAGWMAAIAGYPHATAPMGTVDAIPVGLSFIGSAGQDAAVLAYAYAYEQRAQARPEPGYLPDAEAIARIRDAMASPEGVAP